MLFTDDTSPNWYGMKYCSKLTEKTNLGKKLEKESVHGEIEAKEEEEEKKDFWICYRAHQLSSKNWLTPEKSVEREKQNIKVVQLEGA